METVPRTEVVLLALACRLDLVALEVGPTPRTLVPRPLVRLPLGAVVVSNVAGAGNESEVGDPVVSGVSIGVVDLLPWPQVSPEDVSHDDPMFKFVPAVSGRDTPVPVSSLEAAGLG